MSTTQAKIDAVEFCARPFVRRIYQTLVVALAAFLATLVTFKQPFRGYLAEARLSGPVMEGLDLDEAAAWIKAHDPEVAAVANRPAANPGKAQLRITFAAMQPQAASARVDDLAERWLYQYLPDRLQAYRQSALAELRSVTSTARQQEDAARHQLDELRHAQLAQLQAKSASHHTPARSPERPSLPSENSDNRTALLQRLADLRLNSVAVSGERTEEHPRVRTLRLEAAALEQQLGLLPNQPLPALTPLMSPQFVSHTTTHKNDAQAIADMAAKISNALAELSRAASDRQTAEFCLSERMQDLANEATSVNWSKAAAVSITRLGGTPRCSTLIFAGFLALIAGVAMVRVGRFETTSCSLQTPTELASTLELPILADLAYLRGHVVASAWQLLTPGRVQTLVRIAEIVVAIAALACLLAIAFEPSLARQVLADPFGALSEVLGRFGL